MEVAPNWKHLQTLFPERTYASLTNRHKRLMDKHFPNRKKQIRTLPTPESGVKWTNKMRKERNKRAALESPAATNNNGNYVAVQNIVKRAVFNIVQNARDRDQMKRYRRANRNALNKAKRNKRKSDPAYKLECNLRSRLADFMRSSGTIKGESTSTLIGCSWQELLLHLEGTLLHGETSADKEIDHIFPMNLYDLTSLEDQRRCMNKKNLQFLPPGDNRSKRNKLPTRKMAENVPRELWPSSINSLDDLPALLIGWKTALRRL